jgi:glyoxylase-like metal-dependent hydrolase (beta-lactamase superfamily II)
MTTESTTAAERAASQVAAVRDHPRARLRLLGDTYGGPTGTAPDHLPFRRAALSFINADLGCASYLLGDAGEAVVVDPRLDLDVYLELAAAEGLRITAALDTHIHADHVSGRERLAAVTGAGR